MDIVVALLGLIDWPLLVLFFALFMVNHALTASGLLGDVLTRLGSLGIDPAHPGQLFGLTVTLQSRLQRPGGHASAPRRRSSPGPILALASTLAGNLLIVGSIANIIVVDQAARLGVAISWREHARIGAPITLATLAIAGGWLWWIGTGRQSRGEAGRAQPLPLTSPLLPDNFCLAFRPFQPSCEFAAKAHW
ncbi:MAG: hypothetical protein WCY68_12325 [Desulfuromonadales bacterium]